MKINLEIELSEKEIDFLKKKFINNRNKKYNSILNSDNKEFQTELYSLIENGILIRESTTYNISLSKIGNLVLDKFDRDIKINQILDE